MIKVLGTADPGEAEAFETEAGAGEAGTEVALGQPPEQLVTVTVDVVR